jgi:hypothetical protein
LEDVLELFFALIENKKIIDEYVVISTINACISSQNQYLQEKCFNMIVQYIVLNPNVSHSFWQTSIEGFLKLKMFYFSNNLLKLYPIKYSYSESLWKNVILSNMNNNDFLTTFNLFLEKYDNRKNNDEFRAFENIFNIYLEEVTNH